MPQGDDTTGNGSSGESDASVPAPTVYAYNRRESPSQTRADAVRQQNSMEIWGQAARGSGLPSVKAYREATAPLAGNGGRGVLFNTNVPLAARGDPYQARWYDGDPGVMQKPNGFVAISVTQLLNRQP